MLNFEIIYKICNGNKLKIEFAHKIARTSALILNKNTEISQTHFFLRMVEVGKLKMAHPIYIYMAGSAPNG